MYLKGTFDEEFGSDNWSEPTRRVASKMSRSVVALASFIVESDSIGQHNKEKRRKYSSCTGVFMECHGSITRVLTSASLVRTSGEENSIQPGLKIEVCLPSKRHVDGTLQHYDLHYNVAVVSIEGIRSYSAAKLDEASQTDKVVALGRSFKSGKLLATNGAKTSKVSRFDCKELRMSTCKITKAGIGWPLVDFDGKFVGMNFYDMKDTPYLPRDMILEVMRRFDAERTGAAGVEDTDDSEIPRFIRVATPNPESCGRSG